MDPRFREDDGFTVVEIHRSLQYPPTLHPARDEPMTQVAFPKLLSSQIAFDIARTILDGFDKHYRCSARPARRPSAISKPPTGPPPSAPRASASIYYDKRVQECVHILEDEYAPET
jgi:isocitrate dehydrogenase kinase/phosphatase